MCKGRQKIQKSLNQEHNNVHGTPYEVMHGMTTLTLWPWKWTFKQQQIIYVKCKYFTNQKR